MNEDDKLDTQRLNSLIRYAHDGGDEAESFLDEWMDDFKRLLDVWHFDLSAVVEVHTVTHPDYEWNTDNLCWLVDLLSEERYSELEDGADPNDEEQTWYHEAADRNFDEGDDDSAMLGRVYRLTADKESQEDRVVFVGWTGTEGIYGMHCYEIHTDTTEGPMVNISQVKAFLTGTTNEEFWYELSSFFSFPEQEDLKEWLDNRKLLAKGE